MRKSPYSFALIVIVAWIATGCHTAGHGKAPTWPRVQAEAIRAAGVSFGVPVETDNVATFSQGGATFSSATALAWRTTPATELPNGVDFAVAYLDSPGQDFAPDFYILRAFAEPRETGAVPGRVQVLNRSREIVTEIPAEIDVRSMTVPSDAARRIPNIVVTRVPVGGSECILRVSSTAECRVQSAEISALCTLHSALWIRTALSGPVLPHTRTST